MESEVRNRIATRISRGKVDCTLRVDCTSGTEAQIRINEGVARQLIVALESVSRLLPHPSPINPLDLLRWPGILETRAVDVDALSVTALSTLDRALDQVVETREREGEKLLAMVLQRCMTMTTLTLAMRARVPEIIAGIRTRHAQRVQEIAGTLDPARVEQECALLIQRLDVAEELDRLETHLSEVQRVMAQREPIGRRLDFLMQELNREANTLGSKSAHVDTTGASVELKVLIEQIREQIQNIE